MSKEYGFTNMVLMFSIQIIKIFGILLITWLILALIFNKQCQKLKINYTIFLLICGPFINYGESQTPEEAKEKIKEQQYTGEVHSLEEQAMSLVGKDMYEKLIKGYNEKQWGREWKNLPPFIIKRLPTRFTNDSNYFNDRYQGIPEGCYNAMMQQLMKDTKIETGVDYNKNREKYEKMADKIVYTGKINEYFGYKYGK